MNVGKYKVIGRLGVGGMAEVFIATLGGIGGFQKTVVVKTILPNLIEDDKYVDMFLDEARVAANLSHPNIAQVYEIDEDDGRPFIAMEYVKGPTLGQVIRRAKQTGKQNIPAAAKIISGICLGLDHAHSAKDPVGKPLGIVHRDVSPHNIVVSLGGVPKLLDFGVAKSKDKLVATRAGTMKGKLQYMPVEQIKGSDVDGRADVFAAGVCLYRATTGRLPFEGDTEAAKVHAVMEGLFRPPEEIVADYPKALSGIIKSALARDRNVRCPSAKALHDAIESWLTDEGLQLTPAEIALWMTELFPRFEEESHDKAVVAYALSGEASSPSTRRSKVTGLSAAMSGGQGVEYEIDVEGEGSAVSVVSAASAVSAASNISKVGRSLGVLLIGFLIAVVAGLGAVFLVLKNLDSIVGTPGGMRPTHLSQGVDADSAARQYLEEAKRLVAEGQRRPALTLVEKGLEAGATDPALNIELNRLSTEIRIGTALEAARTALKTRRPSDAMESVKKVLDLDPSNEEALTLLRRARNAIADAEAEAEEGDEEGGEDPGEEIAAADESDGTSKRRRTTKSRSGYVTIESEPPATVFIDGVPFGRTPLRKERLKAGTHSIELRETGYVSRTREVKISGGRTATVNLSLEKETPKPATTPVRVAAADPATTGTDATASGTAAAAPPKAPDSEPEPVKTQPPKDPEPVAAVAPTPKPDPEPEPPPPAVEEKTAYVPKLPSRVKITDPDKLSVLFGTIEREAIKAGASSRRVRGCTKVLEEELAAAMSTRGASFGMGGGTSGFQRRSRLPTSTVSLEVYPMATFELIVEEAAGGKSKTQIAALLKSAHTGGELRRRALGK